MPVGESASLKGDAEMKLIVAALAGACALSSAAMAQTAAPAAAPVPAATPMAVGKADNVLRTGTAVPLRVREMLTTKGKNLKPGQRFNLEVAEAVLVNNHIVIPVGSPAVGEVTEVRNKGMWGKSGYIKARMVSVTANGRVIPLTGEIDDKGVAAGGGAAAVSAVVFLPAGFFMTGTSAVIPIGAPATGFINEDVPFEPGVEVKPMTLAPVAPATPAAAAPAAR